jgi:sulfite oxidase
MSDKMNGDPLSPAHGGPVRVIVPGYLGARWVKWLDTITISDDESQNFYQQRDYKILPPQVGRFTLTLLHAFLTVQTGQVDSKDAARPLWSKYPSMTSLPLNSVVSVAYPISSESVFVKGYAVPAAGAQVKAVQVSADDGQSWQTARIVYQTGRWSWTIWEVDLNVDPSAQEGEICCCAIDNEGNVQSKESTWNLRGVAYNAWGRKKWSRA